MYHEVGKSHFVLSSCRSSLFRSVICLCFRIRCSTDDLGSTAELSAVPQALLDMETELRKRNAQLEARRKQVEAASAAETVRTQDRAIAAARPASSGRPSSAHSSGHRAARVPSPTSADDDYTYDDAQVSPERASLWSEKIASPPAGAARSKIPIRRPSPSPAASSQRGELTLSRNAFWPP